MRSWASPRVAVGVTGLALAVAALGPFTAPDMVGHMTGHLLLGMVAPLLVVLADPVVLALRVLPVAGARRLVRALRSRPVRLLTHPATATVLDVGGLWVLYRTGLHEAMVGSPWLTALVAAHVFAAGVLFTHAVAGHDPTPGRPSFPTRAVWLVAGLAAHGILAKLLWADPHAMPGTREAAELMYYGGDVVDLALMVMLCAHWYRATAPRALSPARRAARAPRA